MRLTIAAVGRARPGPLRDLFDDYAGRSSWPIAQREVEARKGLAGLGTGLRVDRAVRAVVNDLNDPDHDPGEWLRSAPGYLVVEAHEHLCDQVDFIERVRDEDRGRRQHAEQQVERLRKLLISVAPYALKELRTLRPEHAGSLIAALAEFEVS